MAGRLDDMAWIWPDEAIEAMHNASLALLERAGVRVESPEARALLEGAGCVAGPQGRLLVPRQLIEEAVAALPARFTLAARAPERSLQMDAEPAQVYVHNMGGAADIADPATSDTRRATIADQADAGRVMHRLVNLHTMCALVMASDVPGLLEPLYSYAVLALETDKYVGGPGISFPFQGRYLHEMAIAVTGATGEGGVYPLDLAFSPVSPLILGADVTDALIAAVRRGGVVTEILPCPSASTTAPATLSGAVAQQNAEVLAGLVLTQLVAAGTPCYYGPRLSAVDPRTGTVTSGSPEGTTSSIPAVLLARRYGMPCDCYGPTTDSHVIDVQFGMEHTQNALLGAMARPRLLSGPGDLLAGASCALESLVVDDEILNDVLFAVEPRPWDKDALDVDAMVDGVLSPAGFLGSKHTRKYLRSEFVQPLMKYRGGTEEWRRSGRPGLADAARERVAEYLGQAPVGLPDDTLEALAGIIDAAAREVGLAEWPDPRRLLAERMG